MKKKNRKHTRNKATPTLKGSLRDKSSSKGCVEDKYRLVSVSGRENFYVQYYKDGEKKKQTTGTSCLSEANVFLEDFKAKRELADRRAATTVVELLELYIAYRSETIKSPEALKNRAKRINSVIGAMGIDYVRPSTAGKLMQEWRRQRLRSGQAEYSPRTIGDDLSLLQSALKFAFEEGWVDRAVKFRKPLVTSDKERVLSTYEARKLVKSCKSEHIRDFIFIALNTGARKGAILSLTWDRVDFKNRTIDFRIPGEAITNKRKTVVPMNKELARRLKSRQRKSTSDWVVSWDGKQVQRIDQAFRRTARAAGLSDVTPHVLRTTAGTRLAKLGIPIFQISRLLGHTSTKTTEKAYLKHIPEDLREAANALAFTRRRKRLSLHRKPKNSIS